jgi:hypothetical protein
MKTRLVAWSFAALLVGSSIGVGCTSAEPVRRGGAGGNGDAGASGAAGVGNAGAPGNAGSSGVAGAGPGGAGTMGGAGAMGDAGATGGAGASGVAGSPGGAGAAGSTAGASGAAGSTAGASGASPDGGTTTDGGGADGPSMVPGTYTGRPLGGTPQAIPGMIQIESYDTGGSGVAYKASGNVKGQLCGLTRTDLIPSLQCTGQNGSPPDQTQGTCAKIMGDVYLGYIGTGDWLNYTVTVKEAGTYAISTHVGVNGGNTKLMFTFSPTVKTGALALTGTSGCPVEAYHIWNVENIGTIALEPGTYVMRLDFVAAGLNIDWVAFTKM